MEIPEELIGTLSQYYEGLPSEERDEEEEEEEEEEPIYDEPEYIPSYQEKQQSSYDTSFVADPVTKFAARMQSLISAEGFSKDDFAYIMDKVSPKYVHLYPKVFAFAVLLTKYKTIDKLLPKITNVTDEELVDVYRYYRKMASESSK